MKPTKKTKRTKGGAMFRDPTAEAYGKNTSLRPRKDYWHTDPVALIPCATAKEAWEVVKRNGERDAKAILDCIPDTWLDSLLSGPESVLTTKSGTWGCPDIERLLKAIRVRVASKLNLPTP